MEKVFPNALKRVGFDNSEARRGSGETWDSEIICYKCGIKGHSANRTPGKYDDGSTACSECPNKCSPPSWEFNKPYVSEQDLSKETMTKNGKHYNYFTLYNDSKCGLVVSLEHRTIRLVQ